MPRISPKGNHDIIIGVMSISDKVNLYMQDRHVGVDSYLDVEDAKQIIKNLQAAIDESEEKRRK